MQTLTEALDRFAGKKLVAETMHSEVGFTVRHLGLSKVRGRFNRFDATVAVGDDLSELQVRPADGIDIGVDNGSLVGPSAAGAFWSGELRDVRVVLGGMSEQEFGDWLQDR